MPSPGVGAALASSTPTRSVPDLFTLVGRVALVTGGHRGIGLELALALAEAGAVVYCLDLPKSPDEEWLKVQKYAADLGPEGNSPGGRLIYVCGDVTDQKGMWAKAEEIVEKEGRLDICVANAGVFSGADCLDYPAEDFKVVIDVNVNGVLYTAQAAGRQMVKLGIPGSIILIGSISGNITNRGIHGTAYNASKAAVLQMARSMACELAPHKIRVNTVSPGYMLTYMTQVFLDTQPKLQEEWSSEIPLGRLGYPHELRGATVWLAGDGSTFCTGSDIVLDGGHRIW